MYKTYWTGFVLYFVVIVASIVLMVLVTFLLTKGKLNRIGGWIAMAVLLLSTSLSIYELVPCIKDYPMASVGAYMEADATVVEFTYIRDDPDGNGQTSYAKPKFYIHERDEYIVLYVAKVEVGKTYRIRYLPNSRLCEVLYCLDE